MNVIGHALFTVHFKEFEAFISKAFGISYDFMLATRMPTKSIIEYHAAGVEFASQSVRDKAAKLQAGQRVNDPATLLNVMVDRGIIAPGIYMISTKDQLPTISKPKRKWSLGKLKIVGMQV